MMTLSKYGSAIMLFFVMFLNIIVVKGVPFGHGESKLGLFTSIDKIMEAGPYRIEGEGTLILPDPKMSAMKNAPSIYFGLDGHLDFEKKDYEIKISLKDVFGYEDIPLGSYRGLGDTHQIFSEIGVRETMDIRPFFNQASLTKVTKDQLWQCVQKDIEVSRSWINDTQKGFNPIKREVITYDMDLGLIFTQAMIEEMSSSFIVPLNIEEAQLSYHTDQKGNPIALNLDIKAQQLDLEVSLNISKTM
ncbi:MAG: hypothetical protein CVU98_07625 [Firmicutes bacterium HGW-Firmicutes-3]|jgi:hypothetical protein|nr:MAG: hypothetical protein CVU98_07625 [Firmicutes bacterium HGW-Firmicutes-3]